MPSIVALTERKKKSELDKEILICAPLLQTSSKVEYQLSWVRLENERRTIIIDN